MELISMTKFVLSKKNTAKKNDISYLFNLQQIINYAKFLSQPLKLGMFVPCDEKGNMLDYTCPVEELGCTNECKIKTKAFKEAKERVLFEGFSIGYRSNISIVVEIEIKNITTELRFSKEGILKPLGNNYKIVEDLQCRGIILTPNAIKQIGI